MDIATAAAEHQKALDLVTEEPTFDHLRQYDAAASISRVSSAAGSTPICGSASLGSSFS
ncbi:MULTISPECIES: hypothetical protein [unclassified Rhodococcus (in: high G+C Gram-positive bacteria)]|uniref:hypothetical protein n=1 Tax=unclassified Rhodococcus (in: high G+C Gram-positive bacteria) TaxID=192944 RepID=UPI0015C64D99|nr:MULTISPECIES: hypothetical protein [unclassified Rhodococcus (in: high G+C Gram-positive bacteria)]